MSAIVNVFESSSNDPYENLAREHTFLENVGQNQIILYLWQNAHTVVIGKNQNAWRECNVDFLQREKGKLARRATGGGAVYHDIGNLNFSFIADREMYDLPRQLGVILSAVQSLGVHAELQGRNDLAVDGQKFSGNAFRFTRGGALHHGTLLVNTDVALMQRYLQVSELKMKAKGISSIPARVCNLSQFAQIQIPQLKQALRAAFDKEYGTSRMLGNVSNPHLQDMTDWYASWEWIYGETPSFDIEFETRFDWGEVTLQLALTQGHIDHAAVFSDAMDEAFISDIAPRLTGCPFMASAMASAIRDVPMREDAQDLAEALAQWLESLEI